MKTYTLHIDAYTRESIPMARLAEYMNSMAKLLGHEKSVHFRELESGSVRLVSVVEQEDAPKVAQHIADVRERNGSEIRRIDELLADDNTSGRLLDNGAEIIEFPGVNRPKPKTYGPISQEGTLDGILIGITGKDRTKHLHLQNGEVTLTGISTDEQTAKQLGFHLYEPIRIGGVGRWLRNDRGVWELKTFKVSSFQALEAQSVREAINDLRRAKGSGWSELDDPLAELKRIRDEGSGPH